MIFETTKPSKYDQRLIRLRLKQIGLNTKSLPRGQFDIQNIQMIIRWIEINLDSLKLIIDLNKQEFDEGIALSKASDEEP